MKIEKAETTIPICPYCEKELNTVSRKATDKKLMSIENCFVYFCPHCKKVLGIGQQLK